MDRLFATWRMEYIERARQPAGGCLFCEKVRQDDDRANLVLQRGQHAFVMMNLYPYNGGHLMVAPYDHTGSVEEVRPDSMADMMTLAQRWLRILRRVMEPDGFNLGINQGRVAGAGVVDHVHLHVVPRWNGDNNFMPVTAETRVVNEALERTYAKLVEAAGD
ncbi:MAG: HIT family protein [Candidatus Dormibacteria bacterium]